MNGVFVPNAKIPSVNYLDGNLFPKQLVLEFRDKDETVAKVYDLIAARAASGGVDCKVTLESGNYCVVQFYISCFTTVELHLRILSQKPYQGDDECFPYICGKIHK